MNPTDIFGYFAIPQLASNAEIEKLRWLVRLRWLALALFFILSAPGYLIGALSATALVVFVGALAFLFLFNLLTYWLFVEPQKAIGPLFLCFQLSADLLALTILLTLSGGFTNPFWGLFILNAALGGILIQGKYSWPFLFLCHALLIALQIQSAPTHPFDLKQEYLVAIFASHLLVLLAWFIMRSISSSLEGYFESLTQSRVQSERRDRLRAVGALAAGFSHEFASPLNAAKLRIDWLARNFESIASAVRSQQQVNPKGESESVLGHDFQLNLKEAQECIEDCELVIRQMNSSQLDARNFSVKSISMRDFLIDVIDSWSEDHPDTKVDFYFQGQLLEWPSGTGVGIGVGATKKTELDPLTATATGSLPNLALRVSIPPLNFAQVVLNLLDNAHEASSNTKILVQFYSDTDHYYFAVTDFGPGFPPAVIERLGEPFLTTKKEGTGLGLYVSHLLAHNLGGNLTIKNEPKGGARVEIKWICNSENPFSLIAETMTQEVQS